jgi:Potential Monad-binding region of RPAP3
MKGMSLEEVDKDKAASKKEADEFKEKGNAFVKVKDYESAIEMYSMAIETISNESVYFSNRSQCYLSLNKFNECIKDTKKAIELDKCNSKAYYRQMMAYEKIGQQMKALQTCQYWMEALPEEHLSNKNYDRIHNLMIEENIKKKRSKIKWSKFPAQTNFVEKKPHLQSKAPLKNIPVNSRKSQSPIPDKILDKIFNNNTGEFTPEPETNSKLFRPNFMEKSFAKPMPLKLDTQLDDKSKLNEKNEILKANENTSNKEKQPTLAELETLKNHLIVLPGTGPQFVAAWKELSEELKLLYLRNISTNSVELGRLLGAQLDSELLSDIIDVTHKFFIHFNINYIEMLYGLSKNSEMSILAMFLEENDKKSELKIF